MITKKMLLLLPKPVVESLAGNFHDANCETRNNAREDIARMLDVGVDGRSLMKLATDGRKLVQTETAESRLNHLIDHWDNKGVDRMVREKRRKRWNASRKGRRHAEEDLDE